MFRKLTLLLWAFGLFAVIAMGQDKKPASKKITSAHATRKPAPGSDVLPFHATEKTLAKKRAFTRRALVELARWISGDNHAVAAE